MYLMHCLIQWKKNHTRQHLQYSVLHGCLCWPFNLCLMMVVQHTVWQRWVTGYQTQLCLPLILLQSGWYYKATFSPLPRHVCLHTHSNIHTQSTLSSTVWSWYKTLILHITVTIQCTILGKYSSHDSCYCLVHSWLDLSKIYSGRSACCNNSSDSPCMRL